MIVMYKMCKLFIPSYLQAALTDELNIAYLIALIK